MTLIHASRIASVYTFDIVIKAAAWEAQSASRRIGAPSVGSRVAAAMAAAEIYNLIGVPSVGVYSPEEKEILKAIEVLAFDEPDMPAVDLHLTLSWAAYQKIQQAIPV